LFFFDETIFKLGPHNRRFWFAKDERYDIEIESTKIFLKLNMLTSMTRMIAFSLSSQSVDANGVASFLDLSVQKVLKDQRTPSLLFIVMDNAPKNRSKKIAGLCQRAPLRIVYTISTTPQQNFMNAFLTFSKPRLCVYSRKKVVKKILIRKQLFDNVENRFSNLAMMIFVKREQAFVMSFLSFLIK
jgi:hypothetical protein